MAQARRLMCQSGILYCLGWFEFHAFENGPFSAVENSMSEAFASSKVFVILLMFWLALNVSLAPDVVLVGIVVALVLSYLLPSSLVLLSGYRFSAASFLATVSYVFVLLVELVRSNLKMARIVLDPALPVNPAIVKVRTKLRNPVARLLLANSITLTPGTLTVEMEDEWLYVHWVVAKTTDQTAATEAIVSGFEKYLGVMYD